MTIVRVWFTKTGEAAYISLLDLQRVMQRALKRARLPVWYTQGFNPHIYMTFAAPLALGQESLVESLDCKMEPLPENWQLACAALQACLPAGICAVKIEPAGMDPSEIASAVYEVRCPVQMRQDVLRAVQAYNTVPQALAEKKGKKGKIKQIDLKQYLPALEVQEKDGAVFFSVQLPAGNTLTVNPALLLDFLENEAGLPSGAPRILRVALKTQSNENFC